MVVDKREMNRGNYGGRIMLRVSRSARVESFFVAGKLEEMKKLKIG